MCSSVHDALITHKNKLHIYSVRLKEEHGGFQMCIYDPDGAYLYDECYDPDTINPLDEANMFCQGHAEENY